MHLVPRFALALRPELAVAGIVTALAFGSWFMRPGPHPTMRQGSKAPVGTLVRLVQQPQLIDPVLPSLSPAPGTISYSIRDGAVVELDLANERLSPVLGLPRLSDSHLDFRDISSLGAYGSTLIACTRDNHSNTGITIIALDTKQIDRIDTKCESATSDGHRIWVLQSDGRLDEYASLPALRQSAPARTLRIGHATRIGAGDGRLLAAWHSTGTLTTYELATGVSGRLRIAEYVGWIFGLAETRSRRYVVGGWVEKGIRVFDRQTGAPLRTLFANEVLNGLTLPR